MALAYACRISEEHIQAIASEKPNFDMDETISWLNEHGDGFFIRDESAPWDCSYMSDEVFYQIYMFESFDNKAIFHRITNV